MTKTTLLPEQRRPPRKKKSPTSKRTLGSKGVEQTHPDEVGKLMVGAVDPFTSLEKAMRECGLPKGAASSFVERFKRRYAPVKQEAERLTHQSLIKSIEEKIGLTLSYYDETIVAQAPARDLIVSLGILIDKARLLKGEPTAIVSHEERREMDELIEAILSDAKRRGIEIDVSDSGQHAVVATTGGGVNEIT